MTGLLIFRPSKVLTTIFSTQGEQSSEVRNDPSRVMRLRVWDLCCFQTKHLHPEFSMCGPVGSDNSVCACDLG